MVDHDYESGSPSPTITVGSETDLAPTLNSTGTWDSQVMDFGPVIDWGDGTNSSAALTINYVLPTNNDSIVLGLRNGSTSSLSGSYKPVATITSGTSYVLSKAELIADGITPAEFNQLELTLTSTDNTTPVISNIAFSYEDYTAPVNNPSSSPSSKGGKKTGFSHTGKSKTFSLTSSSFKSAASSAEAKSSTSTLTVTGPIDLDTFAAFVNGDGNQIIGAIGQQYTFTATNKAGATSSHTLTITSINYSNPNAPTVTLTLESSPQTFTMSIGQAVTKDVTGDGKLNIGIAVDQTSKTNATLTVFDVTKNSPSTTPNKTITLSTLKKHNYTGWYLLAVFIFGILVYIFVKRRYKKKLIVVSG